MITGFCDLHSEVRLAVSITIKIVDKSLNLISPGHPMRRRPPMRAERSTANPHAVSRSTATQAHSSSKPAAALPKGDTPETCRYSQHCVAFDWGEHGAAGDAFTPRRFALLQTSLVSLVLAPLVSRGPLMCVFCGRWQEIFFAFRGDKQQQ